MDTRPETDEPNPVPLDEAARQPVGTGRPGALSLSAEIATSIVAPLLIPTALLAVQRFDASTTVWQALTLTDIAFGFGAVALASLVRFVSLKIEGWQGFAMAALIVLLFQASIGVRMDVARETKAVVAVAEQAATMPDPIDRRAMAMWQGYKSDASDLTGDLHARDGGGSLWLLSGMMGIMTVIAAVIFIVRER